jgi:regulator of protease activity HflC (stomatin/prohibitin superfamily)
MTDQLQPPPPEEEEENEVLRAARERQHQREAAEATEAADKEAAKGKRGWKTAAAAGLGIGSAAVIAALLYANRGKIK